MLSRKERDQELYAECMDDYEDAALDTVVAAILDTIGAPPHKEGELAMQIRPDVERIITKAFGDRGRRDGYLIEWADAPTMEQWKLGEDGEW